MATFLSHFDYQIFWPTLHREASLHPFSLGAPLFISYAVGFQSLLTRGCNVQAGGWCSCRTVNYKMHRHCSSVWCRASTVRCVHTASCYSRMQQSHWHACSFLASLEIPDFLEREGSLPRRQEHVAFSPPEPNGFSPRFLQVCFNIIFSTRLLFKVVSPCRLTHRRPVSISVAPTRTVTSPDFASCHRTPCYWLFVDWEQANIKILLFTPHTTKSPMLHCILTHTQFVIIPTCFDLSWSSSGSFLTSIKHT
jgi:hypothetical protein